jgi:hypothetical protein
MVKPILLYEAITALRSRLLTFCRKLISVSLGIEYHLIIDAFGRLFLPGEGTQPSKKGFGISSDVKFSLLVIAAQDDALKTVHVEDVVVLGEILHLFLKVLSINDFGGTWMEYGIN